MATKKILGLDLGTNSIGWALIELENEQPQSILGMGSRIVPLTTDDSTQFQKGQAITKNADRTQRRTARKGYDRYQLRRKNLTEALRKHGMLPERTDEHVIDLWQLRADAATEGKKLTLPQIGRVLYHINQKRGYKHSKADVSADSKQTKYVAEVNQRYKNLQERNQTIGQYFYQMLVETAVMAPSGPYYTFRIKDQVFPRAAYIAEFDQIMQVQKGFYPNVLTTEFIHQLRNEIIFYQRPLKSCKHLVGLCEFEKKAYINKAGKIVYDGPKCAPRTSPLAQLCAIWETVNNISLTNRNGEQLNISLAQRQAMVDWLCNNDKMTAKDLQKILGITSREGWYAGKAVGKGIKGNSTLHQLRKALGKKYGEWLKMDLQLKDIAVYEATGELIQYISETVEQEPLYRLWHVIYSVQDEAELRKALQKLGIDDDEVIENLFKIDFVKPGYANKSHKFIRKILPYLMQGYHYSEACEHVGIKHSKSTTKEDNESRILIDKIPLLLKNELRQPIIEKILNQMINIVNALKEKHGEIDEVRIELARELKQSKDERAQATERINKNERENKAIEEKIREFGIRPSRARIQKYKMWQESQEQCFYCGKQIGVTEFLAGFDVEVEHIIPRSVLFDDSFSNKVCACRACNHTKGNMTARDFMATQGKEKLEEYLSRVDTAYQEGRISKTKRDHLLWTKDDIPQDFIDRQLRQSQYIAKKAVEILYPAFRNVFATSGSVTDFLRHIWGYDEILHKLNFPKYRDAELTELVTYDHRGQEHQEERIKNWSKRIDHRHHAIDALTIALTKQGYIQRLNSLNASHEEIAAAVREKNPAMDRKYSLLEKYIYIQPHFTVQEVTDAVDGILISFRAGKKVTTPAKRAKYRNGKRVVVQNGLLVPRGALTEETVYGKLGDKYVVKYALNHPSMKVDDIVDPTIREIVRARLAAFGGKAKDAFAKPLYSDAAQTMEIKSVRCYTDLTDKSMAAVRYNAEGEAIGFAKTGNNHHVAIYQDRTGKYQESIVSFWQAVERKRYGLPIIIEDTKAMWDKVMDMDLPQEFLETLPKDDWQFVVSLQANEMFVLGLEDADFEMAMENKDYQLLNKHLYRVQKIGSKDYSFRHHIETSVDDKYDGVQNRQLSTMMKKLQRFNSIGVFNSQHPHKVRVNLLGEITEI